MDIMTLLGHTTLQMTSRYTHAMPQNLRIAVDSLNKEPLPSSKRVQRQKRAKIAKWLPEPMELERRNRGRLLI